MAKPAKPLKVAVTLSPEQLKWLLVLGDPAEVLEELVDHVCQGVYRPGAWEREWLCKALGYEWIGRLEPDPRCDWRERPKAV